jgi:hypothetical protein
MAIPKKGWGRATTKKGNDQPTELISKEREIVSRERAICMHACNVLEST